MTDEQTRVAEIIYESVHWGVPLTDADNATRDAYLEIASLVLQYLRAQRKGEAR